MRGEDWLVRWALAESSGSPPHARGRRASEVSLKGLEGITPACAGKTPSTGGATRTTTDHPRMRGEDQEFAHPGRLAFGSPPHARGRLLQPVELSASARITPACAGKTNVQRRGPELRSGSPPQALGRALPRLRGVASARITPACAGKTHVLRPRRGCLWDHPRMRGEDLAKELGIARGTGSPPHARGRLFHVVALDCVNGNTPACAGKTVTGTSSAARR